MPYAQVHYPFENKEWFEKNLRIPYPQTLITSWNGIFAVRSDLIKRRSLNFYKSLIGEVDKINAPVEAHFFEYLFLCYPMLLELQLVL
jgi:hypothetical protein